MRSANRAPEVQIIASPDVVPAKAIVLVVILMASLLAAGTSLLAEVGFHGRLPRRVRLRLGRPLGVPASRQFVVAGQRSAG